MRSFYNKPLILRSAKRWTKQIGTITAVWTAVAKSAPAPIGRKDWRWFLAVFAILAASGGVRTNAWGVGGTLTLKLEEEATGDPTIARVELFRGADPPGPQARQMPIRRTVSAGIGVVVDRQVNLELPDGPYRFRVIRGPEYRVVSGVFTLEKTSLDEKTVPLPRMVNMAEEGWLSGDCCVAPSSSSLPLRMAAEDLHVAAVLGDRPAKPIPGRDADQPIEHPPLWIRTDATHHHGLVFYGLDSESADAVTSIDHSTAALVAAKNSPGGDAVRVAIENPFAWELPVWLASEKVDGVFLMGDWLRLDKTVWHPDEGRSPESFSLREPTQVGRYAETIYRHLLEAGIRIAPLAGGGDRSAATPVGYNRLYVTAKPADNASAYSEDANVESPRQPSSAEEWWRHAWAGHSVVTNGPLLRPLLAGKLPGHTFRGGSGEALRLQPELNLAVRDPVDYLEVIHNNRVHYGARLDEFAKAGGRIPPITVTESGWVIIRVLTLHEGHYRAAVSAPWWIEFDAARRVSADSVQFFRDWLSDYEERLKQLPPDQLQSYVPFVQAARRYWQQQGR